MNLSEKIAVLLEGPTSRNLQADIAEICEELVATPYGSKIIPDKAWEMVGLGENPDPGTNFVGKKEYYYWENCVKSSSAYRNGDTERAVDFLMKAKWDFDEWALAHYLLGLILIEQGKFKDALDQFESACNLEPFNHIPMAVMREITRYLVLNP